MSSTNSTTNYHLSQYIGTDKPTYLGDYNADMLAIDTQMKLNATAAETADGKAVTAKNTADAAQTAAQTADGKAVNAQNTADTASSTATSALNKANSNETKITALETANEFNSTETLIGKWINGQNLYRRVFTIDTITNTNSDLVDISNMNIQTVVKLYGMIYADNGIQTPMPIYDSASNYNIIFRTVGAIRGRASLGSGNFDSAQIVIEYTKNQN